MTREPSHKNQLLAALTAPVFGRLSMTRIELRMGDILNQPGDRQVRTIFPETGVVSVINTMREGKAIEVATIGREGMCGVPALLGVDLVPYEYVVQVPGSALAIQKNQLSHAVRPDSPGWRLMMRYYVAFTAQIMQSVACAGLHSVEQRGCRWLLTTHDRVDGDQFQLTHEYLAIMLGTRRASVSQILHSIRDRGLINYHRGTITILNRRGLESASCECYQAVADIFRRVTQHDL